MDEEFQSPSHALKAWLEKKRVTIETLAKETSLSLNRINGILAGRIRVSPETATHLGAFFETGTEYWTSLQSRADREQPSNGEMLSDVSAGQLQLGGLAAWAYVLPDEKRMLDAQGFFTLFGLRVAPRAASNFLIKLLDSPFLQAERFKTLIWQLGHPLKFKNHQGIDTTGYEAEMIIEICKGLLDIRRVGGLPVAAKPYADQAEMLVLSFAKVGIIALIDEATGYQQRRQKAALRRLFDAYLLKEYAAWAKRFPDDFYVQIFRLKGWKMESLTSQRPPVIGKITNEIVYQRLAPCILEQLRILNPKTESGRRKQKHHQWLTHDVGHPALSQHLFAVCAMMRAHSRWETFFHALQLALPKLNEGVQLNFDDYRPSEN